MTRQLGKMKVITSVMQAAEFIVNEWPGTDSEKLDVAKHALVKCYDGEMSPGVARMAFVEAAREADIYVEAAGRPVTTGKLEKWRKEKVSRRVI
ncbi:DUF982 domain-containing protein [Phyllobacterium sp. YR531]|uniref:DUF982 domain-containing protein n=1 Tax=Phyllobacterium sp. YR531 TaxID=1144343 RepID=UPI0012F66A2B|nr:DUF982 domain-containing protein [Phyllobacterium sp. YR531]